MISARWEPQMRGRHCKWGHAAQDSKWIEQRDNAFAASSSAQTSRSVDFVSFKEENRGIFIAQWAKAHYRADQTGKVCVEPPTEYLAIP
eukprot:9278514-Pyramimonas_sp.AAC.1